MIASTTLFKSLIECEKKSRTQFSGRKAQGAAAAGGGRREGAKSGRDGRGEGRMRGEGGRIGSKALTWEDSGKVPAQ